MDQSTTWIMIALLLVLIAAAVFVLLRSPGKSDDEADSLAGADQDTDTARAVEPEATSEQAAYTDPGYLIETGAATDTVVADETDASAPGDLVQEEAPSPEYAEEQISQDVLDEEQAEVIGDQEVEHAVGAEGIEAEVVEAEGAEPEAIEAEGAEAEAIEAEGAEAEAIEAEGAEPEVVEAEGAEPEAIEAEGAEPETVEAEGAEAEAVEAQSVEADSAEVGAVEADAAWQEPATVEDFAADETPYAAEPATEGVEPSYSTEDTDPGAAEPDTGAVAPDTGAVAPDTGAVAPDTGAVAPDTGAVAPDTGAVAPDADLSDEADAGLQDGPIATGDSPADTWAEQDAAVVDATEPDDEEPSTTDAPGYWREAAQVGALGAVGAGVAASAVAAEESDEDLLDPDTAQSQTAAEEDLSTDEPQTLDAVEPEPGEVHVLSDAQIDAGAADTAEHAVETAGEPVVSAEVETADDILGQPAPADEVGTEDHDLEAPTPQDEAGTGWDAPTLEDTSEPAAQEVAAEPVPYEPAGFETAEPDGFQSAPTLSDESTGPEAPLSDEPSVGAESGTAGFVESAYGAGTVEPAPDGSGPAGWQVKGNTGSMLFHTTESPSFEQVRAEVWFDSEETARTAGFAHWDRKRR